MTGTILIYVLLVIVLILQIVMQTKVSKNREDLDKLGLVVKTNKISAEDEMAALRETQNEHGNYIEQSKIPAEPAPVKAEKVTKPKAKRGSNGRFTKKGK